ncbi:inositol monophosphatase family protein [Allochromatium vinosum]|uniref:inositol monophosphatase family protein n=1 Tax=Allochromatium vinosum TaxID=1049 RepID=UPI00190764CE|nr:inositol monophosphatase family protein [Allochromatium vinosum]MBK1656228.1 inositol monophosphatase [Allochromatium vinosum]
MTAEPNHLARLLRDTAAAAILPNWQGITARHKADGSFVTESDLAAQRHLSAALARDFPGIPLLGEEMTRAEQERLLQSADKALWVVDPLDGTSNYAAGFPAFSISLALIEGGRPVLGAILDPVRDECFVAARGQGAFLNGRPIRCVAPSQSLRDCLAMVDLKRLPPELLRTVTRQTCFSSQRYLGSVALEWCWLAAGRFQLYLHGGQKLWDYAAGRLIADEAGAAARHLIPDSLELSPAITLEPRLAIAAANAELLRAWSDCLALAVAID